MLLNSVKDGDWTGVRKNFQKLGSLYLGERSEQTFAGLTLTGLTASRLLSTDSTKKLTSVSDLTSWIAGTVNQIAVANDADGTVALSITDPFAIPGKLTAGSFASPTDVTNTRQYGFELHYSGNNYDVTGIRSRAQLITTDTTATALGGLFQAANNDNINAGVLMGFMAEAIGKSTANASTITTMRGGLIGTEWGALDTVTNLKTLHLRGHSLNAAGAGSFGTGYALYIENEAVGGNGQAYDAGIYFKGTNLSAGNKAFTYGIDFSGGTYGTAEIKLSNSETISNLVDGTINFGAANLTTSGNLTLSGLTAGSILFAGAGGIVSEDNAEGFYDAVNKRWGFGTATPLQKVHVIGEIRLDTTAGNLVMRNSGGAAVELVSTGFLIFEGGSSSGVAFNYNAGTEGARVHNNGFFGVGEAAPETLTEWTHAQPYLTLHNSTHEDTDGGGESRIIGKREDGAGTETAAGQIEISHDGSGANDQLGRILASINTGSGLVNRMKLDSTGMTIYSADASELIQIYHDNTNAYFKWTGSEFHIITDEGTNTSSSVNILGKGTGTGWLYAYDEDDAEWIYVTITNGIGEIGVSGTSPQRLSLVPDGEVPVSMFSSSSSGETQELQIWGYKAGDNPRSLEIGVGVDAADTASFDGLSNYRFDGRIELTQQSGSTVDGALWNDSTQEALQTFVSGIEQTLVGTIFTQTADQTIADTTTETTLFGTGIGTLTLPANFWVVGKTIRIEIHGDFADTGNPTAEIQAYYGATSLIDSGAITLSGLAGTEEWECEVVITCRSIGASGTVQTVIDWEYETTVGSSAIERLDVEGVLRTIDTTASGALDVTFQWGTAAAANTIHSHVAFVTVLN